MRRRSSTYELPVHSVEPAITTDEATIAKADAERIAAPITARRRRHRTSRSRAARLRTWLSFAPTADGGYGVVRRHDRSPRPCSRSWPRRSTGRRSTPRSRRAAARITGVTASKTGYKLDLGGHEAAGPGRSSTRASPVGRPPRGRAGDQGHPAGADHRRGQGRPSEDAQDLAVDDVLPDQREERLRRQHLDPGAPHQRLRRRTRARRSTSGMPSGRSPAPRAIARAARSSTAGPNRRAPWPAASARAPRPCSTPRSGPATRWAPGATTTTTSTAIRSASTRRCSSARRARSRRCRSPTTPTTRCSSAASAGANGGTGYVKFEIYSVPTGRKGQLRDRTAPELPVGDRHHPVHVQPAVGRREADRVPGRRLPGDGRRGPSATGRARSSTGTPSSRTTRASPASRSSVAEAARAKPSRGRSDHARRATAPPLRRLPGRAGPGRSASASVGADAEPPQRVARHLHGQLALAVDRLDLAARARAGAPPRCRCGSGRRGRRPGCSARTRSTMSRVSFGSDVATTTSRACSRLGHLEDLGVGRIAVDRRRLPATAADRPRRAAG